jgi:hypothetical protein
MGFNTESKQYRYEGVRVTIQAYMSLQFEVGEAAWVNLEAGL